MTVEAIEWLLALMKDSSLSGVGPEKGSFEDLGGDLMYSQIKLSTPLVFLTLLLPLGCNSDSISHKNSDHSGSQSNPRKAALFSYDRPEHRLGTHFEIDLERFLKPPRLSEVELPDRPGAHSIWGSTGRDHLGRIYFGVSSYGIDNPSAYLLRLDTTTDTIVSLGDVNGKLDELGVRTTKESPETQVKIHSKICQASDGKLYFSSQDEQDELGDGSRNPKFGGRLLRIDPKTDKWESLLSTPEALIALATNGRYAYALGYFGHMLYRFDTRDGTTKSIRVGSYRGHISRNLLVDQREHAYVVRVRPAAADEAGDGISEINGVRVRSSLVEWNTELAEVGEWPLADYEPTGDTESHGVTGYCTLANGQIAFLTHTGALWLLTPSENEIPSQLDRLGWMHPAGRAYCASLFCPTGSDMVFGFTNQTGGPYEWIKYDLKKRISISMELDPDSKSLIDRENLLIYGSNTIDNQSRAYVVGWKKIPRGFGPHVLRIDWSRSD